jgi:hypothetical protein
MDSMAKLETNRVSTQLRWAREAGYLPWSWEPMGRGKSQRSVTLINTAIESCRR